MAVKKVEKKPPKKAELTVGELRGTHILYDDNYNEWLFLLACYEGTKKLLASGFLERNERETLANYQRRFKEAYGFNYTKSVIDLFNFYLFKKPVKREMGGLKTDEAWKLFTEDCNLYGDSYDEFLTEMGRYASIMGFVGILVDKPTEEFETRAEELGKGVYPYVAAYFPPAILDWSFEREAKSNRPYLAYLKLLDDDDTYRLWYPGSFEIWKLPEAEEGKKLAETEKAEYVGGGINPIGKIPFVWLYNLKGSERPIGVSDVHEVGRIDVSILRNLSSGEEVITYAAFPMMRKPKKEATPDGISPPGGPDDVGVTAVLEFDPEHPESKPDWLPSEVQQPIDSILKWITRKVAEIYRTVNAGGMSSMEISDAPKSGAALVAEFQLLNANLVRKAINLEKADLKIIKFWLTWQKEAESKFGGITVERSRTYDVEKLAADLENSLTSITLIKSKKFLIEIQKMIARKMLPGYNDEQMAEIDAEIEKTAVIPPLPNDLKDEPEGKFPKGGGEEE